MKLKRLYIHSADYKQRWYVIFALLHELTHLIFMLPLWVTGCVKFEFVIEKNRMAFLMCLQKINSLIVFNMFLVCLAPFTLLIGYFWLLLSLLEAPNILKAIIFVAASHCVYMFVPSGADFIYARKLFNYLKG